MSKATTEDWNCYYEGARRRRQELGGDPLEKYRVQKATQEKRFFVGSGLVLAAVLTAFYSVLIR